MHNVTERDGVFTVRGAAWWDLDGAHNLADYPSREQAQKIAHDWEPVAEPVYRKVVHAEEPPAWSYEQIEGQHLNVRSDDGHSLGVVSDSLTTVTNNELWDIAEAIEGEDKGAVMYETGGSLMGGRKVWILLRLREPLLVKGDPRGETIPYYALQNRHDGEGSLRGQCTLCRIVCDNTAKMADLDAETRGTEFLFRHTANISERIEEAKTALAGWRSSLRVYEEISSHLIGLPISTDQQAWFADTFIPMPPPATVSDRVVTNVNAARVAYLDILYGETCEGIEYTAYGLVQAAIEYNQHARRARSNESRFKRAYLDRSTITSDAMRIAQEAVKI